MSDRMKELDEIKSLIEEEADEYEDLLSCLQFLDDLSEYLTQLRIEYVNEETNTIDDDWFTLRDVFNAKGQEGSTQPFHSYIFSRGFGISAHVIQKKVNGNLTNHYKPQMRRLVEDLFDEWVCIPATKKQLVCRQVQTMYVEEGEAE